VGVGLTRPIRLSAAGISGTRSKVDSNPPAFSPGEVASAMVACQFWGLRTRYVGKFGDDYAAQIHSVGSSVPASKRTSLPRPVVSYQSFILIDATGERTVLRRHDERLAVQTCRAATRMGLSRGPCSWTVTIRSACLAANWAREARLPSSPTSISSTPPSTRYCPDRLPDYQQ